MPHSMESDPGLYCSPMSFLWDTRHKRVKYSPPLRMEAYFTRVIALGDVSIHIKSLLYFLLLYSLLQLG